MKKLLVLSFVAGLIVLASCGSGNKPAATTDTTKVKVVEKTVVVDKIGRASCRERV